MFVSMLAAALLSSSAEAKDACSGYKVTKDSFGGGSHVTAMAQGLSQFTAVAMIFEVKSGTAELNMTTKEGGAVAANVPVGIEIPFKFVDGTMLTLKTVRENTTKSYVSNSAVMTMVPYTLGIDAETANKLASSPIEAVRIPTSQGPWDWKPNKGTQKSVMKAAACIHTHVGDAPATSAPAADAAAPAPAPEAAPAQ